MSQKAHILLGDALSLDALICEPVKITLGGYEFLDSLSALGSDHLAPLSRHQENHKETDHRCN